MKLTLKQKMRLAELKLKDAANLTDDEKNELQDLEAKAAEAKEDIDFIVKNFAPDEEQEGASEDGEAALTDEELTATIKAAVAAALDEKGDKSTEQIVKTITEKLGSLGGKSITAKEVEEIVSKNAADPEKIVSAIKGALPNNGVTLADLKKCFEDLASSIKQPRQTQFPEDNDMRIPFEHRSGNLTVAEKQLLNICLMNVSEDAKARTIEKGGRIPTSVDDGIPKDLMAKAREKGEGLVKRLSGKHGSKTITTGGIGSGAELIPVDLSSNLLARLYLESQLANELLANQVDMPTDPFKYPMTTTRPSYYVGAEAPGTDPTGSNPGTKNVTLDAKKLIGMSDYSYEADEDAIVAVLDMLFNGLAQGAAASFEGALIEGDDSATHQHADYHAIANHHTKLFKGFRKYALAGGITVDFSMGNISNTNIKALRKKMGKYGIRPRDLIIVAGPQAYNDLVGLDETLTFEKVGNSQATRILTGEADSIYGIRIIVSGEMREDLNSAGVYDGSSAAKGGLLMIHKPSWIVGARRGFMVEVETDKKQQVNYVIGSFRRAFTPTETPSTSLPVVALGVGATVV